MGKVFELAQVSGGGGDSSNGDEVEDGVWDLKWMFSSWCWRQLF